MVLFSSFNLWTFSVIHQFVGHFILLDCVALFFAEYIQYVIGLWFLVLVLRSRNRFENRDMVVMATISALSARYIVKSVILLFIAEPRPFIYLHFAPLVSAAKGEDLQSFPSGHALFFFALTMTTYHFNKKLGTSLFVMSIIMGFSRVYVGVHWPFDIVVGALLGIGVGSFTYLVYIRHKEAVRFFIRKFDTLGT